MLYRTIEKDIKKWLYESNKALLIEGARQVGKTYIINKVLKEENIKYFKFNLIENKDVLSLFNNFTNVHTFIKYLSLISNETIPFGSVIFLDEIQECKEIITYIKFLVENNNYKFILSASLLGVELINLKSAPVGYLEILHMYPLTLEEFCINQGVPENIMDELYSNYLHKTEVNPIVHKKMMEVFKNYLLVGGMPDAVDVFLNNGEFQDIDRIHKNILELYKRDFTKYETNSKLKLVKIYDLMPTELNSISKKFVFTDVEKQGRFSRYENSFDWLIDAGVALPTYNTAEPRLPLRLNMDNTSFKLFMSDVGLLTSCYGDATKIAILTDNNTLNAGAIYENFIAQELNVNNKYLYYYNNRKLGELDFIIELDEEVVPIEVKSGKDYKRHSALNNCLNNETFNIKKAIVFNNNNVSINNNVIYMPIYMVMFINKSNIDIKIKKIEF